MQNKLYNGTIEKLRKPNRVKMLEVERVVELCLEKLFITKVLDVGTGSGLFAEAFALRNMNVTGIDKNPLMVKSAADRVQNVRFREGSAESLPFKAKTFDLVFLGHVLHESDNPLLVFKEAQRVAKSRIAVLEWPFRSEEIGPPLGRRIETERIKRLARRVGCTEIKKTGLAHMVLFRMKPR
jgi:ubiquinone/menaquinone biosynthesis C-methylase UbiE